MAADGTALASRGIIRDADSGQNRAVLRRAADGLTVRRWITPTDSLVFAIPWNRVNARHTSPAAVLGTIPRDDG